MSPFWRWTLRSCAQGPLAGPRNRRLSAPDIQPARRRSARPVRARRRRLLLRRLAARGRSRLRPDLPSGAARRRRASAGIALSPANFGDYPMASGQSRLGRRFYDERAALEPLKARIGQPLDAEAAFALGLATSIPDDIDWADEIRIAVEERASMSPDALTAMGRTCASTVPRRWPPASSAASRPGRTGTSSARTRSATRAR